MAPAAEDTRADAFAALEIDGSRPFAEVAGCLYREGVCLVRGLYPRAVIEAIHDAAAAIYAARDAAAAAGTLAGEEAIHHVGYRSIRLGDIAVDGRPAADWLTPPVIRSVAGICLLAPRTAVHRDSYVRCARPGVQDLELPFHQDNRILPEPLLNLWIPLMACGLDAPGLEVLAHRLHMLEPTERRDGNQYARMGVEIDAATIAARYPLDRLWHPAFEPGDAFLFYGTTVHRTWVTPAMTRDRLSIDLRLIADLPNAAG